MRNKPRIRFKGFTEDWEQRKLGSILIEYTEKNPGNENLPVLTSSRQGLTKQEDHFGSVQRHDISDYNVIPLGFCTYRNRSDDKTFTFNINRIVPRGLVSKFYPVFEIKNGNADFITEYLNNNIEIIKLLAVNAVGTSQVVLSLRALRNIEVTFPLKAEQVVIGNFIRKLDIYITLHQRKLEKLKLAKKALLQKLFPKNGSQFPEIRFKGFTDAWEQRKFLDLLDAQNGIRRGPFGSSLKKDSFVKKSDYVVYEQQNAIYDNYETRYFISKEKYNELIRFNIQPGDFIMSGAGTIGRISMVPDGIKKGVFNQALIRFKVNKDSINPLYFLKFMQSDMMQKQLTQANPGSAMTNLVPMDELKKWDVTIPSLEEQNRISTFINQIDTFITLHQRKLDKLQDMKKGLLQKMFV